MGFLGKVYQTRRLVCEAIEDQVTTGVNLVLDHNISQRYDNTGFCPKRTAVLLQRMLP